MKKLLVLVMVLCLCLGLTAGTAASAIDEPVDHDELVALAQAEGSVVVYAITSRLTEAAAAFEAEYGIKVEYSNVKDKEIYTKVTTEVSGNTAGADVVVVHDSYRVQSQLLATGYCFSQTPNSLKDLIAAEYQDPLVWYFGLKLFLYNTEFDGGVPPFTNIWAVTDPKWSGSYYFKDANSEGGNFNFLTMLTNDEWSGKLTAAYKAYYGRDIEIPDGQTAGHVWTKLFLENSIGADSETTMAKDIAVKGQNKQWFGWTAFSKLRALTDTTQYAVDAITDCDPFSSYLQPCYILITSNAKHPYAALLWAEYMYTDVAWAPYGEESGSYNVISTLVHSDGFTLDYWLDNAVVDDPIFIYENRYDMEEYYNEVYYSGH
ncbi:MAG: extracellular solute-binding protein [Clostridiales bacterium]|nr:extracellular solute-binding protein [Clostridiales bacterium]